MAFEYWHWLILGAGLMILELVTPTFAALWFGLSAFLVALLVWCVPELSGTAQGVIWIIFSIACTILWFKWIKPLSIDKTQAGLARETTIGQLGLVIQTDLHHGQVKVRFPIPLLGNDEWLCRPQQPVHVGDRVQVVDILGNTFVVQKYH